MNLFLIAAKGKHKGTPIPVKGDLFLLGSDKVCQLRSKLPGIGGQHCAVITRDRKVFARDLDSGQATVVNGEPVPPGQEWPLHSGDRLEVGPLEFLVQFQEKALSQRDAEEWALKALDEASKGKEVTEREDLYSEVRADTASDAASAILARLEAQKGEVKGRLRVFREEGLTVVHINDRHLIEESEIALIRKEILDQLAHNPPRVLLDLKNVQRMSSMALSMIIHLYRQLKGRGSSLALCRVNPSVLPVLEAVGMGKLFPCFPSKEAALAARW